MVDKMKKIILFLSLFIMSCDDISKRMDTLPKPIESGRVVIGRDIIDFTNIDSTLTGDNISYYVGYTRLKCKERNWGGNKKGQERSRCVTKGKF